MYPVWVSKNFSTDDSVKTQNILVVGMQSLLSMGLASSLAQPADFQLTECDIDDLDALTDEIFRFEPVVVLLNQSSVLAAENSLGTILATFPNLRVIVIQEESNWLNIYSSKAFNLTHISDLRKVIEAE